MNKNKISLIIVLTFFVSITSVFAQASKSDVKTANKLFNKEFYRDALPYLERMTAAEPENYDFMYKKAVSYLNTYKKIEALKLLTIVGQNEPQVDKHFQFWLGRADHLDYEFEEAIEHFLLYEETLGKKDTRRKEVEKYIQHCRNSIEIMKDPKHFQILNVGNMINSEYSEHSPIISGDGNRMIFTSRRKDVKGIKEAPDGEYFEDIFVSEKDNNGNWQTPKSISSYLNTTGHEASIQLIDNETKLLLYKFTRGGDFYISELKDGDWTPPYRIDDINTSDFESDAHITPDGNTMILSSDNWSRDGNLDLFITTKDENGKWKPKTRIDELCSKEDEDSPYLSKDGKTLYFSSRGFNTMGGYDIFKSDWNEAEKKWGNPINLGHPINSPDNDIYYYQESNGKIAYMSSFRLDSYGEKDIYKIIPIPHVFVKGKVLDSETKQPIENVLLSFTKIGDSLTAGADSSKLEDDYSVSILSATEYMVAMTRNGDTLSKERLTIALADEEGTIIKKDFFIVMPVDSTLPTTPEGEERPLFTFKDIYYPFDQFNLTPESIKELDNIAKIMLAYPDPEFRISVNGHTDSKGSNTYNITLSKKRAKAAYNYLVQKGVPDSRLEMRHFGESEPIADNEKNGSDNPEGRAKNRRTEFKLIEIK